MNKLLQELRERNIWRVAVAYPSVTFVLLQAVEFFINHYGLDSRSLTVTLLIAVVLFPAAVVWNWRHGEAGAQQFSSSELTTYGVSALAALIVSGWYWTTTPAVEQPREVAATPARTLAVMPFSSINDDPEVRFLGDGIAESLINWLATVPDVQVVSKGASFRLRDHSEDTARIANELNVEGVITGSLQVVGEQVVVSASLVDARTESQLWGDRVSEPRADVIEVERAIVAAIRDGLQLTVTEQSSAEFASGGTDNPAAYEAYLRGHFLIQSTNRESIGAGLDELRQAIRLDPKNADALLLTQVLVAGVGAMIFVRSSFFSVDIGGTKTPVGMGTLLDKFLQIVLAEVKQREARMVARYVHEIVEGSDYERLASALPFICSGLKSISEEDQASLMEDIQGLREVELDNITKTMTLGLLLNKHYGKDILRSAKEAWDGTIRG